MKFIQRTGRRSKTRRLLAYAAVWTFLLQILIAVTFPQVKAQTKSSAPQKLPSAEKVIERYLKAIGGKKRVAQINDATYEWLIQLKDQSVGKARSHIKSPGSVRWEMTFENGQIISATNGSSAWVLGLDQELHTLTGPEAAAARLQGLLDATHLVNYKKANVLARVISFRDVASEPTAILEFSTRGGARLRYWFSATSGLLVKVEDETRKTTTLFSEYVPAGNLFEPSRVDVNSGTGDLTFKLQRTSYNTGIQNSTFDPPKAAEALDVHKLLREVARNQDELERRFTEYSFLQKETDKEINGRGEVKKETVKVFEVFPLANREPILKLISENGVSLSGERAAREQKRVEEEFLKAERDRSKNEQKMQRRREERQQKKALQGKQNEDDDLEISQFLRVCELISPRRERFGERNATVFDFRPRPGFHPSNREEDVISKVVGVVWIDPVDKQVMRLEARLAEGYKMAGGLLLSLRPGAALVMEQTRMVEGVWLPKFAQINLSIKVLLFGGGDLNKTIEWSDYRHFKGDVGDYKLDAPKPEQKNEKP